MTLMKWSGWLISTIVFVLISLISAPAGTHRTHATRDTANDTTRG
jgi:hypothetical protein